MAVPIFYFEFRHVVWHYLQSLDLNEGIADWILPLGIMGLTYLCFLHLVPMDARLAIADALISVLAILIGFSITSLTVLATASGDSIKAMKEHLTDKKVGKTGDKVSLHRLLHITYSYTLLVEIVALFSVLFFRFVYAANGVHHGSKAMFAFIGFLVLHILVLNVRNMTNFYFVFTEKKADPPPPNEDERYKEL